MMCVFPMISMCSDRSSAGRIAVPCDPFRDVSQERAAFERMHVCGWMCAPDRVRVKYGAGRSGDEAASADLTV